MTTPLAYCLNVSFFGSPYGHNIDDQEKQQGQQGKGHSTTESSYPCIRFTFANQELEELLSKLNSGCQDAYNKLLEQFKMNMLKNTAFAFIVESLAKSKSEYAKNFLIDLNNILPHENKKLFYNILSSNPSLLDELQKKHSQANAAKFVVSPSSKPMR